MLITRTLTFSFLLAGSVCLSGCTEETASSPETPGVSQQTVETKDDGETSGDKTTETEAPEPEVIPETLSPEDVKLTQANWEQALAAVAEHKGKIVVLDIWSTSCQPCLREFPNLVKLSEKYQDRVVCLSLNTDYFGSAKKPPEFYEQTVRKILSGENATFDNYLCTLAADELYQKIDLGSIPAVYVYGPDGELAVRFDNDEQKYGDEFTYSDHIIPKIESLLKPAE